MNMERTLVKEFKNGNKLWKYTGTCGNCNGTGVLPYYSHVENGRCFACQGTGIVTWTEKELTPENEAKQAAKAARKWEYYRQKEIDRLHGIALIENKRFDEAQQRKAEAAASEWQGTIGKKITITATLSISLYWETPYGIQYMHIMKDAAGNIFKWVTNKALGYYEPATDRNDYAMEDENGNRFQWHGIEEKNAETFTITGTVKDHGEYKGAKQTALTRCKIAAS